MPKRASAVAVLTLGLWACGDEDRPPLLADGSGQPIQGCERFSYRTCDIREAACQRELFELVACLRNEEAVASAGPPPVSVLSEAQALDHLLEGVDTSVSAEAEASFASEMRGLELLGFLEPGLIGGSADLLDATIGVVAAYYKPSSKDVVVIDRGEGMADLSTNGTLVHEFVHALQDRRHDLGRFGARGNDSSDQTLARSAVVEGEATLYELLMTIAYSGADLEQVDYAAAFDAMVGFGDELSMSMGSPMLTAGSVFPYTYGARYMGGQWLSGRWRDLNATFAEPPASSLQVMLEEPGAGMPALQAFDVLPVPLEQHDFVADDVAGAWVTFSRLLALAGTMERAEQLRALATSWRGDRFWIYRARDGATVTHAAIWWAEWADAASAQQLGELLREFEPPGATSELSVVGARTLLVATERPQELADWVERANAALLDLE